MELWKNPEVLIREEEGDRYLLFNRKNQSSLILNNTAFLIWNSCDGSRDAASITKDLAGRFDLSNASLTQNQLAQVVDENLGILQAAGFLGEELPVTV